MRSAEYRANISKAKRGSLNPMWGKPSSIKQKQAARTRMSGASHPRWKGGKATEKLRKVLSEHKRRTRLKQSGGSYSVLEWAMMVWMYNSTCPSCLQSNVELTVDHIVPISWGGTNDIENIQPLCKSCNSAKRDYHSTCFPPPY